MTSFSKSSFWQLFRPLFAIFYLYLLGDAFFRWDGFSYYAPFMEFIPNVALITILWFFVSVLMTAALWVLFKGARQIGKYAGRNITIEKAMLFTGILTVLAAVVWLLKILIIRDVQTTMLMKETVLFFTVAVAIIITYAARDRSAVLISSLQERISPLVWIFGVWIILSVPLVVFHSLSEDTKAPVQQVASSEDDKTLPNIILVTFDALTARDMSVYGYSRDTTPFIEEWAKNATLFTMAHSESNITTPTVASLMTGKRVWTHQTYHVGGASKPRKSDIENIALELKKKGFYTMALVANYVASVETLGIADSFDFAPVTTWFNKPTSLFEYCNVVLYRLFGDKFKLYDWILKRDFILYKPLHIISNNFSETVTPPEEAFNSFLDAVDTLSEKPFFAWIHVWPPHDPYLPPQPFMGAFDSSPETRTYKEQKKIGERQNFSEEFKPKVARLRARYDEFIKYCDSQFKEFIEKLSSRDIAGNTVVILSSDHGESFEHNYLRHNGPHLYEQMTHIPLIVKNTGQSAGRIIHDKVEQVDIPATILELAHIDPPAWVEGRSLVPFLRGESMPEKLLFSVALQKNPSRGQQITRGTIAVWQGDYKLIHYLEEEKSLLFNLRDDPDELTNIFEKDYGTGQRLVQIMRTSLEKANRRIKNRE